MIIKDVMLFAYDFPHKKTQNFITVLVNNNYRIKYLIAAPWEKLDIPQSSIAIPNSDQDLVHPKDICKRLGIEYIVASHKDPKTIEIIKENPIDVGIISGARILPENLVEEIPNKIINIHPGLLPEMRGLDTLLWSIHLDIPIGITGHFISTKIDKGSIIYKEKLHISKNDSFEDVALRLLERQTDVLITSLEVLSNTSDWSTFENINSSSDPYHSKMNVEMEKETLLKFSLWRDKFAS